MEAAADVLLGMAAEKIQALVIHLCTSAHTCSQVHTLPLCLFHFLSLSVFESQTDRIFSSLVNELFPLSPHSSLPFHLTVHSIYFPSQAAQCLC